VTSDLLAPDVFDRLQRATAAYPAELVGLYRDYLGEARHALGQVRAALVGNDAEQLGERAHYIRGSSLIVGATVVARYCASLEQLGRNSEFQPAARTLEQASAALDAVEAELARRLGPAVVPVENSAA